MANLKPWASAGVSSLFLAFFIIIDASDKQQLWDSSADFQVDIQSSSTSAKGFFNFIAQASLIVTAAVQGIYYYAGAPTLGMNLVVANALGYYLPGVLKMMYSDPRPYWEYEAVQGIECGTGWGNPSGHALYTSSVWLSLCVSLFIWRKYVWTIPVFLWILLIGFDRAYLGVHFYSQVLLGWCFGFAVASVHGVTHGGESIWLPSFHTVRKLIVMHAITAVLILLGILLYIFRSPYWDPVWSQRLLFKCNKTYSSSDAETESFIESAMLAFVPGAALGCLLLVHQDLAAFCKGLDWWRKGVLIVASWVPLALQGGACEV